MLLSAAELGELRNEIHTALERFYRFCAACKVPEVLKFARTIETWQAPIIAALQTGLTNARTEGYKASSSTSDASRSASAIPQTTPSRTVVLPPPITAGHTQPAPTPLLTAKSPQSCIISLGSCISASGNVGRTL